MFSKRRKLNMKSTSKTDRKIHLLFLLRSMEMGGVQKVLLNLMDNLDKDKFDIHLLLNLRQGSLLKEIPDHVSMHYLGEGKENFSSFKIIHYLQLLYRRLVLFLYYWFPFLLKKKIGFVPDVEIAFMNSSLSRLVRSPFKTSRKINWFHSDFLFIEKKRGLKIIEMMNQCDVTVFVSELTYKNTINYLDVPIKNPICIHNAFDIHTIRKKGKLPCVENIMYQNRELKKVVSVGRLVFQKGYDILLEAHAELIKEGFLHQIIIVGNGCDYSKLKERIIEENITDTFILLGERENPYPYISGADFYIQPSRYESYPLAVGEAIVLNKPVIATDCGGIKEMITHRKTGLIVEFSKKSLKEGIKTFLTEPELVELIKENQKDLDFDSHNQWNYQKVEDLFLDRVKISRLELNDEHKQFKHLQEAM